MRVFKSNDGVHRRSISISPELDEIIDEQVEAGVAESRSDWFESAGWLLIELQEIGLDSVPAEQQQNPEAFPDILIGVGDTE